MNPNNLMQMYYQLRSDPAKFFGIPQNIANDPNAIIQHMLNTGKVSQQQVNQAMQMRSNPVIQRLFGQMR